MMKKFVAILLMLSCLLFSVNLAGASQPTDKEYKFWNAVAKQVAQESWNRIGSKPRRVIVLTNSPYVKFGHYSPQAALDGISKETGATPGRGTLLEVHAARTSPLWFVLYDQDSGKSRRTFG